MPEEVTQKITIDELTLGMYVLDVESNNRLFKIKTKGLVKSQSIIDQLKKQGVTSLLVKPPQIKEEVATPEVPTPSPISNTTKKTSSIKPKSLEDEFKQSCNVYDNSTQCIKNIFDDIQSGQKVNFSALNELAEEITESVIRNEFAMSILTRIRNKSTYQWEHAINSGVLICGFCLFLGIKKDTATDITIGAMLHDIGVAKVPKAIIEKNGKLTQNEKDVMQKHVVWGHNICKLDGISNNIITDMIVNHHERLDGSGYPRGIQSEKLSKLARITAIVDVYDAMTGEKNYKKGEQPIIALRHLLAKQDKFDRVIVQKFIKYIGIHPVGSLVKLSDNTLAIVTEGNRLEPLKPKVISFYNLNHQRTITAKPYYLSEEDISIVASVRPEDYKINLANMIRKIIG